MSTAGQADPRRPALVLPHGFALHSGLWGDWPAGLAGRAEPRAIELPGHPFFVATLFQPQVGALAGRPLHPLVTAFVEAAR